jgi:hypothetical protein
LFFKGRFCRPNRHFFIKLARIRRKNHRFEKMS